MPFLKKNNRILDSCKKSPTFDALKKLREAMLSFFNKKSNNQTPKEQQSGDSKSQLDKVQENMQPLDKEEMLKVEGGKTTPKPFGQVFPWNSSFGGTIPQ
jgi:hypothetical protein